MPSLDQLKPGQKGQVENVTGSAALVQRLMELGLLEGEEVEVLRFAPLGDPMEIWLCGSRLSLRKAEAAGVQVRLGASS